MRSLITPIVVLSFSAPTLQAQDSSATTDPTRVPVGSAALVTEPPIVEGNSHRGIRVRPELIELDRNEPPCAA